MCRRVKIVAAIVSRNSKELNNCTVVFINSNLNFASVNVNLAFSNKVSNNKVQVFNNAVTLNYNKQLKITLGKIHMQIPTKVKQEFS